MKALHGGSASAPLDTPTGSPSPRNAPPESADHSAAPAHPPHSALDLPAKSSDQPEPAHRFAFPLRAPVSHTHRTVRATFSHLTARAIERRPLTATRH